jgi:hypothetical protein
MKKFAFILTFIAIATYAFSQGYYVEFKISSETSVGKQIAGNMKSYYQSGNSRSEMSMNIPGVPTGMNVVSLILSNAPGKIYMLNEEAKTYSELETKEGEWREHAKAEYEITVVGKEKVNGYNTTHSIVKVNGKQLQEIWTTKDIDGYSNFAKMKSKYTGQENMFTALADKGAEGMPVRMKVSEHENTMQMDLVKAEKLNVPFSKLSLDGYTKGTNTGTSRTVPSQQEMIQKFQNMTPQEREEMIKQMQQQYGNRPH